ncbi:Uncharacterized protein Adt_30818 [Abeliophyllum distichum]|uniref:Glabrous enhancer-binding protein-like DBD domain-containing protein n=1 Tax=Abeliophyllum distichum TaxID=126358 RepID=A0ABD1RCB1_9LAMI
MRTHKPTDDINVTFSTSDKSGDAHIYRRRNKQKPTNDTFFSVIVAVELGADATATDDVVDDPTIAFSDESHKLFQRLWTDEDEIELLQGFLEYTTQRGSHSSSHHYDTTVFYDQIKDKLQLDFNKNQVVEKLRRLKKKYCNIISKSGFGKDHSFKSPHDQTTFEISCKIWDDTDGVNSTTVCAAPTNEARFDDNDHNNPNFVGNQNPNLNNPNGFDGNSKTPRSRKQN